MQVLYFATTNEGKLKEAREILGSQVEGTPYQIDEIQSLDPVEVAVKKAESYYDALKKPIFVEDVSFSITALGNLPGTYIDAFMKALGNEGIVRLLKGNKERTAVAQATVVFVKDAQKPEVFVGRVEGEIAPEPRGTGFGWDPIFVPKGEKKTFGEMTLKEKNRFSMRASALLKFKAWLQSAYNKTA